MSGTPQTEDGYTRLSNELLEALAAAGLSGRQFAIVAAIIRKTYGYNKKADDIGLGQLVQMTGIDKAHVSRVVRELADANVIHRKPGTFGHTLGLNKRYSQWALKKGGAGGSKPTTDRLLIEQPGLPNEQPAKGVADVATGVAHMATGRGVADMATVAERATVALSVIQGLPNEQPQKTTLQKKENIPPNPPGGAKEKPKRKTGTAEPTPEFLAAWAAYPKREGGDSRADAFKAWTARLNAGATTDAMSAGVARYAAFCIAKGKVGTEWVKRAATFFGPGLHFQEEWTVPGGGAAPGDEDQWWRAAGFSSFVDAANEGCTQFTWQQFRDGKREGGRP